MNKVKQIFYNFLSSGIRGSLVFEDVRKVTLINLFAICGIFYLTFYSYRMWTLGDYQLSYIYIYCTIIIVLMQFYLRRGKRITFVSHVLVIGLFCLEVFFLFRNGTTRLNLTSYYIFPGIYWYYIFPPFSLFMLGRKVGSFYNIALIAFTIFFFSTGIFSNELYDLEFEVRTLSIYSAIFFFSFFFESVRHITFDAFIKTYNKKVRYSNIISLKNENLNKANRELSHLSEEIKTQMDYLKVLNKDLLEQNEKIAQQNSMLELQSKEIGSQRDMLIQQKQSIDDSILYASYIQHALLPSEDILSENFADNFIYYKPRNIIGGDFYYIKKINDYIIVAAADCTGHGVPGALLSMLGIASLSEIVYRLGITNTSTIIAEMCREMRSIIKRENKFDAKDGIDIAICKINLVTKELQFTGAYNPIIIVRDDEVIKLNADKIPVGSSIVEREPKFTDQTIQLRPNDCVYLFSDGYLDQLSGKLRKKFMYRNFKELLLKINNENLSLQKQILEETIDRWRDGGDQTDDVMILGIRV